MRESDEHAFLRAVMKDRRVRLEGEPGNLTMNSLIAGSRIRANRFVTDDSRPDAISHHDRFEKTRTKSEGRIRSGNSSFSTNERSVSVDMRETCKMASAFKAMSRHSRNRRFDQRRT